jgi:hypothetical protein
MKTTIILKTITLSFLLILAGCSKDETLGDETRNIKEYTYNFTSQEVTWQVGFSDYPKNNEAIYHLDFSQTYLPTPLDISMESLKITGVNRSDDLFMFIKKKLTGLSPNTHYNINFNIQFATNAAKNSTGVGGSPAHSVYLKAGATLNEPLSLLQNDGMMRMNIDKSNQSNNGKDMIVLGDLSNGLNSNEWALVERSNSSSFSFTTDEHGTAWIIIGTDSGFEGKTTLYYYRLFISFEEL